MKPYSQALFDLLHGQDTFLMADLYTITLASGQVLRYSGGDMDISWDNNLFVRGPNIERGATRIVIGLEVDTNELTITAGDGHVLDGLPFVQAVAGGSLDGAHVDIDRAFFTSWQAPVVGTVNIFSGRVSTVPASRAPRQKSSCAATWSCSTRRCRLWCTRLLAHAPNTRRAAAPTRPP